MRRNPVLVVDIGRPSWLRSLVAELMSSGVAILSHGTRCDLISARVLYFGEKEAGRLLDQE